MCFYFLYNFVWNNAHSKTNSARYYNKCTLVFKQSTRYSCHITITIEYSRKIFEKYSNIKSHENPSSGSRVPYGRTDGQTDMAKLLVAFRNSANAPKTVSLLASDVCLDVMNNPLPSDVKKYTRISLIRN